jgi:hypothetical protein
MTSKRLNAIVADMVDVCVKANGYDPRTGVNGGDRELAQGEVGKAILKARKTLLLATGLSEEQIAEADAAIDRETDEAEAADKAAKLAKKAEKAAAEAA